MVSIESLDEELSDLLLGSLGVLVGNDLLVSLGFLLQGYLELSFDFPAFAVFNFLHFGVGADVGILLYQVIHLGLEVGNFFQIVDLLFFLNLIFILRHLLFLYLLFHQLLSHQLHRIARVLFNFQGFLQLIIVEQMPDLRILDVDLPQNFKRGCHFAYLLIFTKITLFDVALTLFIQEIELYIDSKFVTLLGFFCDGLPAHILAEIDQLALRRPQFQEISCDLH